VRYPAAERIDRPLDFGQAKPRLGHCGTNIGGQKQLEAATYAVAVDPPVKAAFRACGAMFECTLSKPPQVAAEHAREDQGDDEHPNHENGNQKHA
jgi:hypothetical protein